MARRKQIDQKSTRLVTLRAGNFGNSHIYLRQIIDFFPPDSIGPSSRRRGQGTSIRLNICCFNESIETDIAGDKMIFRKRFWGEFFDHHKLEVGDMVAIEKISDYQYAVYPWIQYDTNKLEHVEPHTQEVTAVRTRYIAQSVRREVWKRDEGKCVECSSQENLEFDHIIPVSKGGSSTVHNVQLLCTSCNRIKAADI